jgi:hypothetical protein
MKLQNQEVMIILGRDKKEWQKKSAVSEESSKSLEVCNHPWLEIKEWHQKWAATKEHF